MVNIAVLSFLFIITLFWLAYRHRLVAKQGNMGFFLAGRGLKPAMFIATFVGTAFSTASIVGVPGFFYQHGVGAWIFAVVGMSLLGIVGALYGSKLLGLIRDEGYETYSPVEIVGLRYHSGALSLIVAVVTSTFVVAHLAVQLVGIGRLFEGLLGGIVNPTWIVLVFLICVVGYSLMSGAEGIAVTDMIQTVFVTGGIIILAIVMLNCFGWVGGFFQAVEMEDPALLSLPGPEGFLRFAPLFSMIALLALAGISQPRFSMRLMMTTDSKQMARMGIVMTCLAIFVFSAALVVGIGGRVWVGNLTSGDAVVGAVLNRIGTEDLLVALFVVGIFSAAMSTIDSQLIAISGIIKRDILGNIFNTKLDKKGDLISTYFLIITIALVAFLISLKPPELVLEMAFLVLAGGAQLVPTYLGQFYAKRSPVAATLSIIVGLLILVGGRYVLPGFFGGFDPGLVGLLGGGVVFVVVSQLTPARRH